MRLWRITSVVTGGRRPRRPQRQGLPDRRSVTLPRSLCERVRVKAASVLLAQVALANVGVHRLRVALVWQPVAAAAAGVQAKRRALGTEQACDLSEPLRRSIWKQQVGGVRHRLEPPPEAPRRILRPLDRSGDVRVLKHVEMHLNPETAAMFARAARIL